MRQAISNERATLDGTRSTSNVLQNDDQWILNTTSNTPVLVPSNGYTFERTAWQVWTAFLCQANPRSVQAAGEMSSKPHT